MYNDGQAICLGSAVSAGNFSVEDGLAVSVKSVKSDYNFLFSNTFNDMCESGIVVTEEPDIKTTVINNKPVRVEQIAFSPYKLTNHAPNSIVSVSNINAPVSLLTANALVVGDASDNKYILNHLSIDKRRSTAKTYVLQYDQQTYTLANSGISIVRQERFKQPISSTIFLDREVTVGSAVMENRIKSNSAFTSVIDGRATEVAIPVSTITKVYVEDNKPPTPTVPNNSSLKSFTIVTQKYSYLEYLVRFEGLDVVGIVGLPQGIQFENDRLKGTVLVSGDFNVIIYLSDGTAVQGFIKIPELPRQL